MASEQIETATATSCRAKLRRAAELVEALAEEWATELTVDRRYSIRREVSEGGRMHALFVDWHRPIDTRRWSVIVGEVVHDLNSALDHLVYGLVLSNGARPHRRTAFPKSLTAADFRKHGSQAIRGVALRAATVVERVQPFQRVGGKPGRDPLAMLHSLWIADKHHALALGVVRVGGGTYMVPDGLVDEVFGYSTEDPQRPIHVVRFDRARSVEEFCPNYHLVVRHSEGVFKDEDLSFWFEDLILPRVEEVITDLLPELTV